MNRAVHMKREGSSGKKPSASGATSLAHTAGLGFFLKKSKGKITGQVAP
jgi:hypothetical protein